MNSANEKRRERRRLFKRFLRPLPRRSNIHRYPILKLFKIQASKRPYLWSFRQTEVSVACYAGAVMAMLPTYGFQIPLALLGAIAFRANLPVMVAIQFITNPLTIAPLYLATLKVGNWLITTTGSVPHGSRVGAAAYALVVGGIVCGLAAGLVLDLFYRFILYEKEVLIRTAKEQPEEKPSSSDKEQDSVSP